MRKSDLAPKLSDITEYIHSLRFVRQSLSTCLLLYGCSRDTLLTCDMILDDEIKDLPSRFVLHGRCYPITDPGL
jgi:hypothetical protein